MRRREKEQRNTEVWSDCERHRDTNKLLGRQGHEPTVGDKGQIMEGMVRIKAELRQTSRQRQTSRMSVVMVIVLLTVPLEGNIQWPSS